MNLTSIGTNNYRGQAETTVSSQGAAEWTNGQVMQLPAPEGVDSLLWSLSNLQERRSLLNNQNQHAKSFSDNGQLTLAMPTGYIAHTLARVEPRYTAQHDSKGDQGEKQSEEAPYQATRQSDTLKNYFAPTSPESTPTTARQGSDQQALEEITQRFQDRFSDVAQDKSAFHEMMRTTFGDKYDVNQAEAIRQQTLKGDFSWMPEIKLVSGDQLKDLSGAQGEGVGRGAYDQEGDTVYLNRDLLTSDKAMAEKVLTEEIGHAIDTRVNVNDAKGDEGDIFARLVGGEEISAEELENLQQDNDHGLIEIDGKKIEVEYSWLKKKWKKLKKGVKKIGHAFKKFFQKVIMSQIFQIILTICMYIPVINVFAIAINVVVSAYRVVQGIKNKSFAMVLSGVAGMASGVAKFGAAMGASSEFVSAATSVADYAAKAAKVYNAVANKDFASALSLATGSDSVFEKASQAYKAAKNHDYLAALGIGASLAQDVTGSDSTLQSVIENVEIISTVASAVKSGNYGAAASVLADNYGDDLNLSDEQQNTIKKYVDLYQKLENAKQLVDNRDYAAAATLMYTIAQSQIVNPDTTKSLEEAGETIRKIDTAVNAVKEGRYVDGIALASEVLDQPLDDNTRKTLEQLQSYAEDLQAIKELAKSGVSDDMIQKLRDRVDSQGFIHDWLNPTVVDAYESAKNGDYLSAVGASASVLQELTGAEGDHLLQIVGQNAEVLQKVEEAVKRGDYSTASSILSEQYGDLFSIEGAESGKLDKVVRLLKELNQAKQSIEKHDYAGASLTLQRLATQEGVISTEESRQRFLEAAQTAQKIDRVVTEAKQKNYVECIAAVSELLNKPLDEQTRSMLVELHDFVRQSQKLLDLEKSGATMEAVKAVKDRLAQMTVVDALLGQQPQTA